MKNQIKNAINKLFAFVALAMILTVAAFAQMPTTEKKDREQIVKMLHHQAKIETAFNRYDTIKIATAIKGASVLSNQENFNLGGDFVVAMLDAEGLEDDKESLNYTIVDLVYLIDRLENQPEAAQLQKTLKSVARGTATALQTRKEIETVSKSYLSRQTGDGKWYLNAGTTTMNLSVSTYFGRDAEIKKGLSELQALIKIAPKGTPKEVVDPMNGLAKYIAQSAYTEEDYAAIFDTVGEMMEAVSA